MGIFGPNQDKSLIGKKIVLDHMEDPDPIPDGATGTVIGVDGWGHIHVQWDNGRSLSVIPGEDRFEIKEQ